MENRMETPNWQDPNELFTKPEPFADMPDPDFVEKATPVGKPVEAMKVESLLKKGGYKAEDDDLVGRPLTREEMNHFTKDPHFNEGSDSEKIKKIKAYINRKDQMN